MAWRRRSLVIGGKAMVGILVLSAAVQAKIYIHAPDGREVEQKEGTRQPDLSAYRSPLESKVLSRRWHTNDEMYLANEEFYSGLPFTVEAVKAGLPVAHNPEFQWVTGQEAYWYSRYKLSYFFAQSHAGISMLHGPYWTLKARQHYQQNRLQRDRGERVPSNKDILLGTYLPLFYKRTGWPRIFDDAAPTYLQYASADPHFTGPIVVEDDFDDPQSGKKGGWGMPRYFLDYRNTRWNHDAMEKVFDMGGIGQTTKKQLLWVEYMFKADHMEQSPSDPTAEVSLLGNDAEEGFRGVALTHSGFNALLEVKTAMMADEALGLLRRQHVDLMLVDMVMPEMNGIELLRRAKEEWPGVETVMLTGHGTIDTAIEAMKLGAHDYLTKPCKLSELEIVLQRAREKQTLSNQNELLREAIQRGLDSSEIAGGSAPIDQLRQSIAQVAAFPSTVLIEGESGTGKELVARALHRQSPQSAGPFIAVNCATLREELLESELFGHELGAFTGAVQKKRGLFEVADGGTLLIDEIGEMSFGVQAKLLRGLETGEFRPLGSVKELFADVRVVAATNRDMQSEVRAGRFREDLYYRINVVSIRVPPLRERREDIPILVQHFLAHADLPASRGKTLNAAAVKQLMGYDWPGNVRQLFNCLEHALILSRGTEIGPGDLPETVTSGSGSASPSATSLEAVERDHILKVLALERGNRTKTAEALGIHRRQLYRLMDKYHIENP